MYMINYSPEKDMLSPKLLKMTNQPCPKCIQIMSNAAAHETAAHCT